MNGSSQQMSLKKGKLMDHYFTNNENLKSEIRQIDFSYGVYNLTFLSDNGVFSKNKVDYGSFLLLDTFIKNSEYKKDILDVGCGYGFIGISLSKIFDAYCDYLNLFEGQAY